MKKLLLVVGIGIGFILGSKAGRAPYERLEGKVREVSGRPDVQHAVSAVSDSVSNATDQVVGAATQRVDDLTDKIDDVAAKAGAALSDTK
jgi:hypothetical protein